MDNQENKFTDNYLKKKKKKKNEKPLEKSQYSKKYKSVLVKVIRKYLNVGL